jgi:hypothetical protein
MAAKNKDYKPDFKRYDGRRIQSTVLCRLSERKIYRPL